MKYIKTLGIDLAKNVFQIHGADGKGKCVERKRLTREKFIDYMSNLPTCTVAMEACTGANHWARKFRAMGHTVKIISPHFVKPFVKSNKNDRNDAEAIVEAASRPQMRFVAIKELEQQDIQTIHRVRELIVKQRSALANQIRGLLAEYGITIAKGIGHIRKQLPNILSEENKGLTARSREIFSEQLERFKSLDDQVDTYDKRLGTIAKQDERCQRLMEIEGVGPLIATAAMSTIGNAKVFKNGRELAAWLGLVPGQRSSGNKIHLVGISKRGDRYLRTLLIHGARAVVYTSPKHLDPRNQWIADKVKKKGSNKTAVAVANKNVRVIWALLTSGERYQKFKVGMRKYFSCATSGKKEVNTPNCSAEESLHPAFAAQSSAIGI